MRRADVTAGWRAIVLSLGLGLSVPAGAAPAAPGGAPVAARSPKAAPPSAADALAELGRWLARPALPDPALVLRLAEAAVRYGDLDRIYGPRHPTLQAAAARVAFLRRAAARAPAAGPAARQAIAAGLRRRALEAEMRRSRLAAIYGARHPRLAAAAGELRAWRALSQAAGAVGGGSPQKAPGAPDASATDFATLAASRAEHRGRLRSLRLLYLERHPRVVMALAAVRRADKTLASLSPPAGQAACRARVAAFDRAIARLRAGAAARRTGSGGAGELEAALDELVVERAALRGAGGCP